MDLSLLKKSEKKTPTPPLTLEECLAKTESICGATQKGVDVFTHSLIVGLVAEGLLKRLPEASARLLPKGVAVLAAMHDFGKVSPSFQQKIYANITAEDWAPSVAVFMQSSKLDESRWGGHPGLGYHCITEIYPAKDFPELNFVIGAHHGSEMHPAPQSATCEVFGGKAWQKMRHDLVRALAATFKIHPPCDLIRDHARLVTGFITLCDWVGSGEYFQTQALSRKLGELPNQNNLTDAQIDTLRSYTDVVLEKLGFHTPIYREKLNFSTINGFLPNTLQYTAHHITQPGTYIIEAAMGEGKTEAALLAAYQLLSSRQASGLYFALPSRITSNLMHKRVDSFLKTILKNASLQSPGLGLIHGSAQLTLTEWGEEGRLGESWFAQKKRGLLSPFAVGTIDQALLSVMNVRHANTRLFGLSGKVIVLDEIHSYDAYTNALIHEFIKKVRQLGATVIILSATLNSEQRAALLNTQPEEEPEQAYPLLSACHDNTIKYFPIEIEPEHAKSIPLQLLTPHDAREPTEIAVEEVLRRIELGQLVLWIENTVAEAQDIYSRIATQLHQMGQITLDGHCITPEAGLLHSSFLRSDRQTIENKWVDIFGKEGRQQRLLRAGVLVGTQVLEQSLDIDADFLVTRLAPIDLLLQRLGRVGRHMQLERRAGVKPEAWVLAPHPQIVWHNPEQHFGASGYVYHPYCLSRSLLTLLSETQRQNNATRLTFPTDVRRLVNAAYNDHSAMNICDIIPDADLSSLVCDVLSAQKSKLEKQCRAYRQKALRSLSQGKALDDEIMQTRISDREQVPILILRKWEPQKNTAGKIIAIKIESIDEKIQTLPLPANGSAYHKRLECSNFLERYIIEVDIKKAPPPAYPVDLELLSGYLWSAKVRRGQDFAFLRLCLYTKTGRLADIHGNSYKENLHFTYSRVSGYRASKQ